MKRLVLFGIVIFFVIIGGFLVVDKVWLHKVFKITPGSCLILEEKYCKTGDFYYENNILIGINFKLNKGSYIFSPVDGDIFIDKVELDNGKKLVNVLIGKDLSLEDNKDSSLVYNFLVDGDILNNTPLEMSKITKGKMVIKVNKAVNPLPNVFLKIMDYSAINGEVIKTNNVEKLKLFVNKK